MLNSCSCESGPEFNVRRQKNVAAQHFRYAPCLGDASPRGVGLFGIEDFAD